MRKETSHTLPNYDARLNFAVELAAAKRYFSAMRRCLVCLLVCYLVALSWPAWALSGRIAKVLPYFLDSQGRHALSPSLYERDAYQARLRQHPEMRFGMLFDIEWRSKGGQWAPLKLMVELRGVAQGEMPRALTLEKPVEPAHWPGRWTGVLVSRDDYKALGGEVTAWRVTLWEGKQLLSEQKSFLW